MDNRKGCVMDPIIVVAIIVAIAAILITVIMVIGKFVSMVCLFEWVKEMDKYTKESEKLNS